MQLVCYLCVNYVVLDLLLCDGDVLENDLQSHRHHAGHPVDQAGADVTGHPPLEQEKIKHLLYSCFFFTWSFCQHFSLWIIKTFSRFCFVYIFDHSMNKIYFCWYSCYSVLKAYSF